MINKERYPEESHSLINIPHHSNTTPPQVTRASHHSGLVSILFSGLEKARATHTVTILISQWLNILHRFLTCANCTQDERKHNMLCRMQHMSEERRTFSYVTPLYRSIKCPRHPSHSVMYYLSLIMTRRHHHGASCYHACCCSRCR